MYCSSVDNNAFYGKTKFLSCNSEGKNRRISDCPFGTAYFGETRGLINFVKKHSFPHADIEETIGTVHDKPTYRIYFADPKEIVSDTIKQKHDYIVYDIEPSFPDIRLYFDTDKDEIKKGFEIVKDYYKRLENSANGNFDILNNSRLKQKIADICSQIFDEGNSLRTTLQDLQSKLKVKTEHIKLMENNISLFTKELNLREIRLPNQEKMLDAKKRSFENYLKRRNALKEKFKRTPEEYAIINKQIEKYNMEISKIKAKINKHKTRIEYIKTYLKQVPDKIELYRNEINRINIKIADLKIALLPVLKKLQDVYTINGIKIIKHI